jgi:hypothetical protein
LLVHCRLPCPARVAPHPLSNTPSPPSRRLRRAFAFADATAITVTVVDDDIAHAQTATDSDSRAWPAGVVEEKWRWV